MAKAKFAFVKRSWNHPKSKEVFFAAKYNNRVAKDRKEEFNEFLTSYYIKKLEAKFLKRQSENDLQHSDAISDLSDLGREYDNTKPKHRKRRDLPAKDDRKIPHQKKSPSPA